MSSGEISNGVFDTSKMSFYPSKTITQILLISELKLKANQSQQKKDNITKKYKEKVDLLKHYFENLINDVEVDGIVRIIFPEYSAKSKSIYNLFIDLSNGQIENDIFKLKDIKVKPTPGDDPSKKIFDFKVKNIELFSNWHSDIKKLLSLENMLINQELVEIDDNYIESLNLSYFNDSQKYEYIYSLQHLTSLEKFEFIEDYENNFFEDITFAELPYKNIRKISSIDEIDFDVATTSEIVGILDSKISNKFHSKFEKLITYTNLLENEDDYLGFADDSHAESVSSLVMFGDKLNGFDDGCGVIPVSIFAILSSESNNKAKDVFEKIEKVIKENHTKIKIWILSFGINEQEMIEYQITPFGIMLDNLMMKYNVKFIVAGGNDKERANDKGITPPSDSELSISVNALKTIDGDTAEYSRLGFYGVFGNKPTLSYFGGDRTGDYINSISAGSISEIEGTSFATPLVARRYHNIFYREISAEIKSYNEIIENKHLYTELTLISEAINNTDITFFNEKNERDKKNLLGAGKLPIVQPPKKLSFFISIPKGDLKSRGEIEIAKKRHNQIIRQIPLPKLNGGYDYVVSISSTSTYPINHIFGCDYVTNSSSIRAVILNDDGSVVSQTKAMDKKYSKGAKPLTSFFNDGKKQNEEELSKIGKWRRLYVESIDISQYNKNIKNLNLSQIQLNLERTYRYTEEKDFSTFIIIKYKANDPEQSDELADLIMEEHKKFGNIINDIEVIVEVDDSEETVEIEIG